MKNMPPPMINTMGPPTMINISDKSKSISVEKLHSH